MKKFSLVFYISYALPLFCIGYTTNQSIIIVYHYISAADRSIFEISASVLSIVTAFVIASNFRIFIRKHIYIASTISLLLDAGTEIFLLYNPFIKGLFDIILTSFFAPIYWNIIDYYMYIFYVNQNLGSTLKRGVGHWLINAEKHV